MKLFICSRTADRTETDEVVSSLLLHSENSVAILRETEHDEKWKEKVEKKIKESDFVVFILGADTFNSDPVKWEYAKAKELNKQIIGLKISTASEDSILFCQGFQVFDQPEQSLKFLFKVFEDDRKLKFEQYKMMVSSTEKVTEQRLKVNNLFFTVTSSILSVAFVLGKTFEFSIAGILGMLTLTLMAFIVSFFWEKLVYSYGQLNTGKFKVIDKIEKQLRTNMFEDEWKVLTQEVKYEPNTKTEVKIIKRFRAFIVIIGIAEIGYVLYMLIQLYKVCK